MDLATPPKGDGAQRAIGVESRLDKGAGGPSDGSPSSRLRIEPIPDLPDAVDLPGETHHADEMGGAALPILAYGPGENVVALPALDDHPSHETLGISTGAVTGDRSPFLDIRGLTDLGDSVDVSLSGRGQQERGQRNTISFNGGHTNLEGVHARRS